jgi:hypothetical protein
MPISGPYMCGSGTHPGGGVIGIPKFNVSSIAIRDARGEEIEESVFREEESVFRDSACVQKLWGKGEGELK